MRPFKPESHWVAWHKLGFRYAPKTKPGVAERAIQSEVDELVAYYSRDLDIEEWAKDHRRIVIKNSPEQRPAIVKRTENW
jgi:hypothetical protein